MIVGNWVGETDIVVENVCYLGSYISSNGSSKKGVRVRIGKAAASFGKLSNVWSSKSVSITVKVKLYESLIPHIRLGVTRKDKIKNDEIITRTGQQKVEIIIRERRPRWLGQAMRMGSERILHQELNWKLEGLGHKPGRQRKNWKDIVTKDLKTMGINWGRSCCIISQQKRKALLCCPMHL